MELIRLEDVCKTYHLDEIDVPVLRGISLAIDRGEMVALMGASGSGKTTLMNILGCLDRPSSGKYWLGGQEMSRLGTNHRAVVRSEKLGFVFQNFNLLPRTTALQNVLLPLDYAQRHPARLEARSRARLLLDHVGLADRVHHVPSQMSGGQQQRVAIGRALVNRPSLLLADEPTGNLDSQTSVEILRMFQRLNAEGITVVLVTHDADVAAYAHRTIRLVDGRIASDERTTPAVLPVAIPSPPDPPSEGPAPPRASALPELVSPTLRTALGALRRNKLRSALTALGIIIGVGAVIAMTEIGQGSKTAIQKNIASMGANRILVQAAAVNTGGVSQGIGSAVSLTPRDVEELVRQCPAVANAAPIVGSRSLVIRGRLNWIPDRLTGTTPVYLEVRNWEELAEGESFTDVDVRTANAVCLLGQTVRRELFDNESPIGQTVRIGAVNLRVIGLLASKGANMTGQDQDDTVIVPWTTLKYRISATPSVTSAAAQGSTTGTVNTLSKLYPGGTTLYPVPAATQAADTPQLVRFANIDAILFSAVHAQAIPEAIQQVIELLRQRHRLSEDKPNDFKILNLTELDNTMAATSEQMGALLFIVALISLLVGGVGIMNIMLVSVTERTREIGLRMAVGAHRHHVLRQFLVEAVALCLLGGTLGILAGRGASLWVRSVMCWPVEASLTAILAAVLVSAGVGVVFGFYPAWKAARLDPIEALRYE